MHNPYVPRMASVAAITEESQNTRTFTIAFKQKTPFDPQPGQFIELSLFGHGEFPVSIAGVSDAAAGVFQTTIRRMGGVTEKIGDLVINSPVGVRGPFGKGYPIGDMKGKDLILVGGGLGISSIKYLLDCLLKYRERYERITLLYGAATPADIFYKYLPNFQVGVKEDIGLETMLSVDRPDCDWNCNVGNVVEMIKQIESRIDIKKTMVAACGPGNMMKAVVACFTSLGFKQEQLVMSFERRMQCGIGKCGHCKMGEKRVCIDGPVMPVSDVGGILERIF